MSEGLSIQSGRDTIQAGGNVNQISGDYVAGNKTVLQYQAILRPLPVQYRTLVQPLAGQLRRTDISWRRRGAGRDGWWDHLGASDKDGHGWYG